MTENRPFSVDYDSIADVLYIARSAGTAVRGVEDSSGVVWRYDEQGRAMSATVLDFRERWERRENELARHLSRNFSIPARQMLDVLDQARARLAG